MVDWKEGGMFCVWWIGGRVIFVLYFEFCHMAVNASDKITFR